MTPKSAVGIIMARAEAFTAATSIRAATVGEKYEILGAECRSCHGTKRIYRTSQRKGRGTGWRCAGRRCDAAWPIRYGYDAGGASGRRPYPANLDRLIRYADLGLKLRGLTIWQVRVLETYAQTVGMPGRRLDLVLDLCRERWPRRKPATGEREGWTLRRITQDIAEAHRRVERNLERRGIFDEGGGD